MTKTQITVRVSPDTMVAIDAAVKATGTTRNHIIDRWLAAQAAADNVHAQIEAGRFASAASDCLRVSTYPTLTPVGQMQALRDAVAFVIAAIDELAGTAPDDAQ